MRRIVKIGGSLLLDPTLPSRLDQWLESQPPAQTIAIVGGGQLIDAMRGLDATYDCESAWLHWRCVELLRVTFELLCDKLPNWSFVSTHDEFEALQSKPTDNAAFLVAVDTFYSPSNPAPLPEDWSTTTDAIAGWLSILLSADELVLLKSCDVPSATAIAALSQQGIIDGALPGLAERLCPIRYINFATPSELP
ncbi:MAG: protein kinase [Planctomycetota bacterium]